MKRIAAILIIASSLAATVAYGQGRAREANRQKWLSELRAVKREFIAKELDLNADQQAHFFPIYDEMDAELAQINTETRDLEQKALTDPSASDTEILAAAQASFQQKKREGDIEIKYFERLSEVLTPRQLISLKNAERKFTQQLVQRHGHIKARNRGNN